MLDCAIFRRLRFLIDISTIVATELSSIDDSVATEPSTNVTWCLCVEVCMQSVLLIDLLIAKQIVVHFDSWYAPICKKNDVV